MRRFRFSIATLLLIILFVAVAVAALRAATDAWDSGVFGVTSLALLTSVLLALHRTGQRRAFWLGFALFGWTYFLASLVRPIESRLPTTKGLALLGAGRPRATPLGLAVADFDSDGQMDLYLANASAPSAVYLNNGDGTFRQPPSAAAAPGGVILGRSLAMWRTLAGTGGSTENFVRIGHSLTALVLAFLGGHLSRSLRVSEPRESGEGSGTAVPPAVV